MEDITPIKNKRTSSRLRGETIITPNIIGSTKPTTGDNTNNMDVDETQDEETTTSTNTTTTNNNGNNNNNNNNNNTNTFTTTENTNTSTNTNNNTNNNSNNSNNAWKMDEQNEIFYQLGVYKHSQPINELDIDEIDGYYRLLGETGNQNFLYQILNKDNRKKFIEKRKIEIKNSADNRAMNVDNQDPRVIRRMVKEEDRRENEEKTQTQRLLIESVSKLVDRVKANENDVDTLARENMKSSKEQSRAKKAAFKARQDLRNVIYEDRYSDILGNFVDAAVDPLNVDVEKERKVPVNIEQPGIIPLMIVNNYKKTMENREKKWKQSLKFFFRNYNGKSDEELGKKNIKLTQAGEGLRDMLEVNIEMACAGQELASIVEGWAKHTILGTDGANETLGMLMNKAANNKYDMNDVDNSLDTRLIEEKWYDVSMVEANKKFTTMKAQMDSMVASKKAANTATKIKKPTVSTPTFNPFSGKLKKVNKLCNKDARRNGCARLRLGTCRFVHPSIGETLNPTAYKPVHGGLMQRQRWAPHVGYMNGPPPPQQPQQPRFG